MKCLGNGEQVMSRATVATSSFVQFVQLSTANAVKRLYDDAIFLDVVTPL